MTQSSPIWKAIDRVDNYNVNRPSEPLHRFLIRRPNSTTDLIIGWIRPPLIPVLKSSPASDIFVVSTSPDGTGTVQFSESLDSSSKRSEALAQLCQTWKDTGLFNVTIGPKFWRDELYPIYYDIFKRSGDLSEDVAFVLERTCCSLFGLATYVRQSVKYRAKQLINKLGTVVQGVHLNMLLEDGGKLWVPRRSKTKQTLVT